MTFFRSRLPRRRKAKRPRLPKPPRILILILLASPFISGANCFELTPTLEMAHRAILSLHLKESDAFLAQERQANPDNLLPLLFENSRECLELFLSEDEHRYSHLVPNRKSRIQQIDKATCVSSPWKRFLTAEIRIQWAAVRIRFGDHLQAFFELSKAQRLLNDNLEEHPDFLLNHRSLALLDIISGAIPKEYHWIVRWFSSMTPNQDSGIAQMDSLLESPNWPSEGFLDETIILYLQILHTLAQEPGKAWSKAKSMKFNPESNPLHCFLLASMATKAGLPEKAQAILQNRPPVSTSFPFPQLDYLHGAILLNGLCPESEFFLERFINSFKGKTFVKTAYLKLSWFHLLEGDTLEFHKHRKLCMQARNSNREEDEHAHLTALNTKLPNISLLKARLLFDGSQYGKALESLNSLQIDNLHADEILEFYYRRARIRHNSDDVENAITDYLKTIDLGSSSQWHYACNSALSLGNIYESLGQKEKAGYYYALCLSLQPSHFRKSIHHKARTAQTKLKRNQ